jgi:hypothetical protein
MIARLALLATLSAAAAGCAGPAPASPMKGAAPASPVAQKVWVVLWFDTEDYLSPAADDAALRIATFLTNEGIRATFKVVGEKARVLEKRGRTDVIDALKKHELGFHSNFHSVHPTPAEYLSTLGWDEGVAEFERREGPGHEDVRRIFGQNPSCYGQPGSSWGPQSYGAMRKWGMSAYLDSGSHVGFDKKPMYYCGLLTMYDLAHHPRTGLGDPKDVEKANQAFKDAHDKLLKEGGGIVSIWYHPCEFIHKKFWDSIFIDGANPPREAWTPPPQKTAEETKIAFDNFEAWMKYIKSFPDVGFVTAREAATTVWADRAHGREFSAAELREIAAAVGDDATYQLRGDLALAPSEILLLLNTLVLQHAKGPVKLADTPYGTSTPVTPLAEPVKTDWSQFSRTAADVDAYLRKQGRVPPTVWLGSTGVPPESYLAALARVAIDLVDGKQPDSIEVRPAKYSIGARVADDSPRIWGWLFPKGFHAPALMALARQQAWTIKPAILHGKE